MSFLVGLCLLRSYHDSISGAKFVFVTSDPKRTIYSQFYAATLAEEERRAERGDYGGKRKTKINYRIGLAYCKSFVDIIINEPIK